MKKKLLALLLGFSLLLVACNNQSDTDANAEAEKTVSENEVVHVKIGTSPTPHGEIVEALKDKFLEENIEVEVINFDDYVQPNLALSDGDLDLNYFQHLPYLESFSADHNLDLVGLGQIHVEPLALYSEKYESVEDIEDGAEILIPNDPSNGSRALLLLANNGLITLEDPTDINATEENIVENPKNLKFTPVDAVNVSKSYVDVDGGIINANYAIEVGLNPVEDGLLVEGYESPYANLLVSRQEDKDNEVYKKVLEVLQSEESRKIIEEKFQGAVKPVF